MEKLGKSRHAEIGKWRHAEIGRWGNGEMGKSSSKEKCGVIRLRATRLRRDMGECK